MSVLSLDKKKRNEQRLGSRIKSAREKLGYTQKELAGLLGLEYYTMISQIERGYMSIPPTLWVPLAIALHLDRFEFVVEALSEVKPSVYEALFDDLSIQEAARLLRPVTLKDSI